jgi:hypothetical protein
MVEACGRAMCLSNRAIFMLLLLSFVQLPLSEPGLRRSQLKDAASVPIPVIVPVTVLGFGYRLSFFARVVPCLDIITPKISGSTV